jgi:hypothetical protein
MLIVAYALAHKVVSHILRGNDRPLVDFSGDE